MYVHVYIVEQCELRGGDTTGSFSSERQNCANKLLGLRALGKSFVPGAAHSLRERVRRVRRVRRKLNLCILCKALTKPLS